MSSLNINNEYGSLTKVILGVANSFGGTPQIEECYDPKSKENVINGTFPIEKDLIEELSGFLHVLEKYNVNIIRPEIIENYNQIFSRDIAFVIENKIIVSGIIDERKTVVNFAKLFQYLAPIVLGMISEKSKIIIVITVETNPTKTSSDIPPAKNEFSRFNSEYAALA